MTNILIDPDSIATPSIDASREEIEAWLDNLQVWLKEALAAHDNWLHSVEVTQLLREKGLFPSFEALRSWQRKYKLDINPKLIERDINAFFRNKDRDALNNNAEYSAASKCKKDIIKFNYKKDKYNITFWYNRLQNIWNEIASLPRLGDIADIHRGMEYKISLRENEAKLFSEVPREGFARGLRSITSDFEPYVTRSSTYLNMDPELKRREAYRLPWDKPKVIVNAGRLSTDRWLIAGAIDEQGLVYTQNFHGIWPTSSVPIEVIAALLNGPVVNAFLSINRTSRHNQVRMLQQAPIPHFTSRQIQLITSLVREYMAIRELWHTEPERAKSLGRSGEGIVGRIESEILRFYNLSMGVEKELIAYFEGYKRPSPIPLTQIESSPQNRLYPSLISVEDVRGEGDHKIVDIEIFACEHDQIFHLPITLFPQELREKISPGVGLWAGINIEAKEAKDLVFENIELAPEPRQELRERFA